MSEFSKIVPLLDTPIMWHTKKRHNS